MAITTTITGVDAPSAADDANPFMRGDDAQSAGRVVLANAHPRPEFKHVKFQLAHRS